MGTAFSSRRVLVLKISSIGTLGVGAILGRVFVNISEWLALNFLELSVWRLGPRGALAQLILVLLAAKEVIGCAGNGQNGV